LGSRLLQAHARFHAPDHLQVMTSPLPGFFGVECNRHPELIGSRRKLEGSRHHGYDGEAFAIQINRLADNTGIGTKPAFPQTMAKDDDMIAASLIFFRAKRAT